jgi:hypothetical protein
MKIYQHASLSDDPTQNMDAVTKQYVDRLVSALTQGAGGGVFFTNIAPTSTGNVGAKQYVPNTVPSNKVITDGTTDTNNVRVTLIAEGGGQFYSPTITVDTNPPLPGMPATVALVEDASDKRFFTGYVDLTNVTADVTVTATSSTGGVATCVVHRAAAGPQMDTLLIGALPGSQTEVKSGDVVQISGRIENAATYVEIIAGGAAGSLSSLTLGGDDSFGTGYKSFSGTFTVGSGAGAQTVSAHGRNALGTFGNTFVSTNTVTLNQTYPTIGARTITYPAGQTALKGTESATVTATITNADTVAYTTSANLSVANPSTYAASKTVTRVSGTYVTGSNNYTITATKTSNGAVSTASSAVVIADAAPTASISITGNPTRLLSSPTGVDYVVVITPTETLSSAPSLTASSGTWQGAWTQSGNNWQRTLRIVDGDAKGAQTFSNLVMTNQASVIGNTITAGASYTVGGFATRTITFAAFEQYHAIGTLIGNIDKVTAKYSGTANNLTLFKDTVDHFQGFTIVNAQGQYDPNGGYLFLTDSAYAQSNTTGTLMVDITEAA